MRHVWLPTHIASAVLCAGLAATPVLASADDDITLSGCLVRATNDAGYLITNAPAAPAHADQAADKVTPNAFGGDGGFASVFYWLENDDALEPHVGHRVEIAGDLKDPKDGELKVDRKDRWTELEVKTDGRSMRVNVPHTSVIPAADAKEDPTSKVIVRRVAVDKVKMLGASCTS